MDLIIGALVILLALIALTAVRVSRVTPWRPLLRVAVATGSLRACVEFLRYCAR